MDKVIDRRRNNRNSIFGLEPLSPFPGHRDIFGTLFGNDLTLSGLNDVFKSDFGVKVVEKEGSHEYRFALPGIDKENISIDVNGNILEVTVDQRDETGAQVLSSRVTLPQNLDYSAATAESKNGLLIVSIPTAKRDTFKVPISGIDTSGSIETKGSQGAINESIDSPHAEDSKEQVATAETPPSEDKSVDNEGDSS